MFSRVLEVDKLSLQVRIWLVSQFSDLPSFFRKENQPLILGIIAQCLPDDLRDEHELFMTWKGDHIDKVPRNIREKLEFARDNLPERNKVFGRHFQ